MSIQDLYAAMFDLWDQFALSESKELKDFEPYIATREEQRLIQFLMTLFLILKAYMEHIFIIPTSLSGFCCS